MFELSAWTRYSESCPGGGNPETFALLKTSVKKKLVANSPLRVCKWRYTPLVEHIERQGGIGSEEVWEDVERGLLENWPDDAMCMGRFGYFTLF